MATAARRVVPLLLGLAGFLFIVEVRSSEARRSHGEHTRRLQEFKASLLQHKISLISPSPSPEPDRSSPRVYQVISYGADPTAITDSTEALLKVFNDVGSCFSNTSLLNGIRNLGGVQIDLQGGSYLISRPLKFPSAGVGNIVIQGGTLQASDQFPPDGYLIDLSSPSLGSDNSNLTSSSHAYNFEFITLRDLLLDCNFRGGAIAVINSVRTGIDNCYITHFATEGIHVTSGHETLIRDSFLGQHITAGNDPDEKNFSGTAINLAGNDNIVSNVVIFSAATGILVSGQANLLTGVHCYNKATGYGGTGIYLKLPGLTQTRIVDSYMDFTGIVAEDPVQLVISNNFFLGDAFVTLKSVKGMANGVSVVDNIFSGTGKGVGIVQLDETGGPFVSVDQVLVDRNSVQGMATKATVAKSSAEGNGRSWSVDFSGILLFSNLIRHVQYSASSNGSSFPSYVLRNVSGNRVVIESDTAAYTNVYVTVDQGLRS